MYTNIASNSSRSPSTSICANATWNSNSTAVNTSSFSISSYWNTYPDIFVDNNNNLYTIDAANYRVVKFALSNPSVFTVVAVTNYSSQYSASSLFVDSSGDVYTSESMVSRSY
jgi:hypothetical protein